MKTRELMRCVKFKALVIGERPYEAAMEKIIFESPGCRSLLIKSPEPFLAFILVIKAWQRKISLKLSDN